MKITELRSTLPGIITLLHVDEGKRVDEGDPVLSIECMKQLHDITAPAGGTVRFKARLGEMVEQDQIVAHIEGD